MKDNRVLGGKSLPDHIRVAIIALWLVISVGFAAAQDSAPQTQPLGQDDQRNGEIRLLVVDPLGAVIAKARVKLSDNAGTVLISQATAYDGSLRLPGIAAGSYVVEISQQLFQTYNDSVNVKAGSITRLDVTLNLAQGDGGRAQLRSQPWWTQRSQ